MIIELKPHEGWYELPGQKPVKGSLPQDRIFIDGHCVGYVGHAPDAAICLLGNAAEGVKQLLRDKVDRHKGVFMPDRVIAVPYRIGESEEKNQDD